jgi:hypothetical protein
VRLRAVLIAVLALLVVAVALPFYGTQTESGRQKCTLGAPEDAVDVQVYGWSWWPLGTRCVLVRGNGIRFARVVPPWRGDPWADVRVDDP